MQNKKLEKKGKNNRADWEKSFNLLRPNDIYIYIYIYIYRVYIYVVPQR